MTKQSYFWATPSGHINLMKAEDMPVKPERPGNLCRVTCGQWLCQCHLYADQFNEYEAALQAAKASSVPIQDQDKALDIMWRNDPNMHNPISFGNWKHAILKPGTIYGPFSLRYEIQERHSVRCAAHTSEALKKRGHVPGECTCKCEVVAILYDDTPEKEESQEEGIRLLEKCDRTFESLRKIVIVLKEAEPEKLPELVHNIEIDFQGIQAVIRDYTRKQ